MNARARDLTRRRLPMALLAVPAGLASVGLVAAWTMAPGAAGGPARTPNLARPAAAVPAAASATQYLPEHFIETGAVLGGEPLPRGERVRAAVRIDVLPGYHVNANPASEEWLIPTEVRLAEGVAGLRLEHVYYPEALERSFAFYSGKLRVYEGSVVVGAILGVEEDAPLGPVQVRLVVRYQACNDDACFAPKEVTVSLPGTIAPAGATMRPNPSPLLRRAPFPQQDGARAPR